RCDNNSLMEELAMMLLKSFICPHNTAMTLVQQRHFYPIMKEMVGGCCVCSDERGWAENPLVYCDGQGCTVAVHQACYGIVTVPTGPWFCRKCESQERAARVRCELCPSRDGALKKTDNSGWAHVVCALYIPEVRFGNVTTMEPIILQLIPTERFSKVCYICEEQGKGSRATVGACMQCNKSGCKQQFHVTCAQALGLLCEEAGNYLDNVKYCGYCQHHYSKLKKGGNVKTIPPYKPIPADNGSSDSSPEKESDSMVKAATKVGPTATKTVVGGHSPSVGEGSLGVLGTDLIDAAKSSSPAPNLANATSIVSGNTKTESAANITGKKRKAGGNRTPTNPDTPSDTTTSNMAITSSGTTDNQLLLSDTKKLKVETSNPMPSSTVPAESVVVRPLSGNVITSAPSSAAVTSGSIVVSVPLAATSIQPPVSATNTVVTSAPTLFQQLQQSIVANNVAAAAAAANAANQVQLQQQQHQQQQQQQQPPPPPQQLQMDDQPNKRQRTQSTEKAEKGRKQKRGGTTGGGVSSNNSSKRSSRAGGGGNNPTPPPQTKDSPPSSPGSETTSVHSAGRSNASNKNRTNKRSSSGRDRDDKDVKLFQNGVSAPHMLGNQLNPSSTMAQKMSDTLSAEMEAHSIFTESSNTSTTLVGPQLHSRVIASVRNSGSGGRSIPQTLDQLLERQWEQGSQFLMEQAQHFDIASLLSCLHQLRAENLRLEEHVNSLLQRRDHLLAVNARLAIPLTSQPAAPVNNVHPGSGSNVSHQHPSTDMSRNPRINNSYVTPHPMENGLPPDPSPPAGYPHQHRSPATQPSPTIRQSPAGSGYMLSQSPLNPPPGSAIVSPVSSTPGVVRSTSATPDPLRGTDARRVNQQQQQQQMVIRRDTHEIIEK
ncbi:hypothetical protein L9F63_014370, partial [Diploptera punctata]